MSSKFFWCWISSHQVTTPTFNHQREQSWDYKPNAQSSENHRVPTEFVQIHLAAKQDPTNRHKTTYTYDLPNDCE